MVAPAPDSPCASTSFVRVSASTSGTSPITTTTVSPSPNSSRAAATASPVPRGSAWTATTTPSGMWSARSRFGPSTTTTFAAPAASAAASGHAISGRPQSGCSTLGTEERIRVPSPAARMTTVGAGTRAS
jgi:hypothetical protein